MAAKPPVDNASAPLADYFFIAGIESSGIFDSRALTNGASASPHLESTIEEPPTPREETPESLTLNGNSTQDSRSPTQSPQKRFSWDARKSISSIVNLESSSNRSTGSARSSATIKPTNSRSQDNGASESSSNNVMTDLEDFEAALRRFTSDRESVLTDFSFSVGGQSDKDGKEKDKQMPSRKQKTQRLTAEDLQPDLKSGVGSVRRRLSTMNRLQKPGTVRRGKPESQP